MDDTTRADEIANLNADIQTALDPSLPDHVAETAWSSAFKLIRKYKVGLEQIKPIYDPAPTGPVGTSNHTVPDENTTTRFGKYNGWTLGEIIDSDENYFRWLVDSGAIRSDSLRAAAERIYARNSL